MGEEKPQAPKAGKESYAGCQVAKCVVPPRGWEGKYVRQTGSQGESELYYNGLLLNYKITSSYESFRRYLYTCQA